MAADHSTNVADLTPDRVWEEMAGNPDSALVDVRTRAEWAFVGIPDVSELERRMVLVEWRTFPTLGVNSDFVGELQARLSGKIPGNLYFLCRSGQRSRDAAECFSDFAKRSGSPVRCVNVAEGFEGDLDAFGHRGSLNGWKSRGLSWKQT